MNESEIRSAQSQQGRETANRSGAELQFRAGGRVLSLFSTARHSIVLRSLAEGPIPFTELSARAGQPTPKALRGSIGNLIGLGALEARRPDGHAELVDNALTPLGHDLLSLAGVLESWLARAPTGPLDTETEAAKAAIKALVAGWSSAMLRALAARPLSLAELDGLMKAFSQLALERRLASMRLAGQVVALSASDRSLPVYAVTEWGRRATAPLLAAIRCERLHLAEKTAPPAKIDFETLFLLSLPLLQLPTTSSGRCQLAVETNSAKTNLAGISVVVERGAIVSCVSTLDRGRRPASRVYGTPAGWLEALVRGDLAQLDFGAPGGLSLAVVEALRENLYG